MMIGGRQFGPLHRATQDSELMPESEILQLECGSRFEGGRRAGGHVNGAESQTEELVKNAQAPSSHSVRCLRYPTVFLGVRKRAVMALPGAPAGLAGDGTRGAQ